MKASASVVDLGSSQHYQQFPAQAARHPAHSQLHLDAHGGSNAKSIASPSGYATPNHQTQPNSSFNSPISAAKGRETSWPIEGFSDLHLSGSEPRIFPGVVSRKQRRESIRKNSGTESDEHALMMLRRSADNKSSATLDMKVDEADAEKSDAEMEEAGGDD
jgi:AMP deaminase